MWNYLQLKDLAETVLLNPENYLKKKTTLQEDKRDHTTANRYMFPTAMEEKLLGTLPVGEGGYHYKVCHFHITLYFQSFYEVDII